MKNNLFILVIFLCGFTQLYAEVKLPEQCSAFMPEVLIKHKVLPETEANKLANSPTFGQDVIPQGEKRYWIVYSDRSENKTYKEPRKMSPLETTLRLGEELRIAKIENGFALVYQEPKISFKYPAISKEAESRGWVPMENLVLWNTCPANDKGIYNKALITLNMDMEFLNKEDKLRCYENPENLKVSTQAKTGMQFYFIMKKLPNGMVLLSEQCNMNKMIGTPLYGWVDTKTYVPWNQRSCIEPNWDSDVVERLKGKTIPIKSEDNQILYEYDFGKPYTDDKGNYLTGPDKYRMPSTILRYPILDNDSGNENEYKCTTFGILGETNIQAHLDKLDKAKRKNEKILNNMSKLNMIFVIDGTRSMGKYFPAVKDAIKRGCEYLIGDSEQNQYTPKVGLVIYRDYSDGEKGLIEYLPMSKVDDVLLAEYLDNAGKYGAKSSSADRTNEEALFKGLETALDTLKMGYSKDESNLMMVIGDCGNDEKDTQCLTKEEIVDRLVENNINLMTFQVRRNDEPAWLSFNSQMREFQLKNVQRQYEKVSNLKVKWVKDADGFDVKPTDSDTQFYIASIRYKEEMGVDIEVSKLTSLMERSIGLFAKAITLQRRAIADIGSDAAEDRGINEAFAIAKLGKDEYERMKRERQFVAVTGYTKKTSSVDLDYWKSVIFISKDELIELMERLEPVSRKANVGNRKEYVSALKAEVQKMLPGVTDEEMSQKSTGEIMAMITGLNAKSAALSGPKLVDIQDPTVISEAKFNSLVQNFKNKFRNLRGISSDKDYKYIHKSDGNLYYWIPVDQLP